MFGNTHNAYAVFGVLLASMAVGIPLGWADDSQTAGTAARPAAGVYDAAIEEITVTARRREENVQDVPIAMSVVGGKELEVTGTATLAQLQQLVPNLQVISFNPRNTNVNIRGLGSNVAFANDGLENGVGFYIDQVYYGRLGQSQFDLVDLEQVEVLRGPQGTLFGKNTTAGAVNISTRLPTFDPEFNIDGGTGDYDGRQLQGSASGPIIADVLAGRLSLADVHRDGFIEDVTTGSQSVQNYDNSTARGQLLYTPTDALNVRLIADYGRQRLHCCVNLLEQTFTTYENGAPIVNNFEQRAARAGYTPLPMDPYDRKTDADSPFAADSSTWGTSVQADYAFDNVALTSITAWREWKWDPANDGDGTALPVITLAQQKNRQEQASQEIRLASSGVHTLDYVVGLYYFWQIVDGYGATAYGASAPNWFLPAVPVAISDAALNGFTARSTSNPETNSYAAFGQTTWHINDALSLTTGLRYTFEEKNGSYTQVQVAGAPLDTLPAAAAAAAQGIRNAFNPNTDYTVHSHDGSVSGTVNLAYQLSDGALVYATYSRGGKSQGLNLAVLPAGVSAVVDPEKVNSYEIGAKSELFDRRLTLNGAVFRTDISDYQTAITEQVVGTVNFRNYISNIPEARSQGVEFDARLVLADNFWVTASGAYADAYYVDYPNGPTPVEALNPTPTNPAGSPSTDLSDEPIAGAPKYSGALGVDYTRPLDRWGLEFYGHADYAYRSSFYTEVSDSKYSEVDSFGLVNARLGVRSDNGRWDCSAWAKNLLDEDYFTALRVASTGTVAAQVGDPRTLGVTLRTTF
jgi:iron complex outermembrane receptor protein